MEPASAIRHSGRMGPQEAAHRGRMAAVDVALIALSIGIGLVAGWGEYGPLPMDSARIFTAAMIALIWPMLLWDLQTRDTTIIGEGPEEYRRVLMASVWTFCLTAAACYLFGSTRSKGLLIGVALTGTVLLFVGRNVMRIMLHRMLHEGDPLHRVFVVAPLAQAGVISQQLARSEGVFGEVGSWPLGEGADPDPAIIVKAALHADADTIMYAPTSHDDPTWPRRLGWAMEDSELSLLVSPSIAEIAGPRLTIQPIQGMALVRVELPRFSGPARMAKRALDIVGSLLGIAILAIPLAVVAVAIKLDDRGPVFFRQARAGAGGSIFECWKLRTMVCDADSQRAQLRAQSQSTSATFKMKRDPRITRVGPFLRRFSLDELPQLWNVLRGDMSLVGPRPHPLDDAELYDDVATRRLLAKPGMTGLWQVSGRSDLDWEDAVMLDLYYVENWSISLDMIIIIRTSKAVLSGKGAY